MFDFVYQNEAYSKLDESSGYGFRSVRCRFDPLCSFEISL